MEYYLRLIGRWLPISTHVPQGQVGLSDTGELSSTHKTRLRLAGARAAIVGNQVAIIAILCLHKNTIPTNRLTLTLLGNVPLHAATFRVTGDFQMLLVITSQALHCISGSDGNQASIDTGAESACQCGPFRTSQAVELIKTTQAQSECFFLTAFAQVLAPIQKQTL